MPPAHPRPDRYAGPGATDTPSPGPTNPATPVPTDTPAAGPTSTPGGPTPCPVQFVDVPPGSTFYDFVRCLACQGIVGGYPCGGAGEPCPGLYYRPGNQVTRGQVSKIVAHSPVYRPDPWHPADLRGCAARQYLPSVDRAAGGAEYPRRLSLWRPLRAVYRPDQSPLLSLEYQRHARSIIQNCQWRGGLDRNGCVRNQRTLVAGTVELVYSQAPGRKL